MNDKPASQATGYANTTVSENLQETSRVKRDIDKRAIPRPPYTAQGVTLADMFDEEWYLANGNAEFRAYFKQPGALTPWQHYLNNKNLEPFRSPCRWFDPLVYFSNHPDVKKAIDNGTAGADVKSAIDHFLKAGQFENRDGSAWFNHNFYLTTYPDVAASLTSASPTSAMYHFIKAGLKEKRFPCSLMSGSDTVNVIAPSIQYTFGGDDTLNLYPNPNAALFDNLRVHGGSGRNLYVVQPGKGGITLADFDPANDKIDLRPMRYVLFSDLSISQQGADTRINIPDRPITLKNVSRNSVTTSQFVGLFVQGVGITVEDLVDADYYRDYNPGVAESGWDPVQHYLKWGQFNPNLRPSRFFNPLWYLQQNPDVQDAVNKDPNYSAAQHYATCGQYGENRRPSLEFDPQYYLNTYSDVKQAYQSGLITPYKHFHDNGLREGRSPVPPQAAGTLVTGNDQADVLYGTGRGNRFDAGKGNNVMYAMGHPNTFVITPDASSDTIYSFDPNYDTIEIKNELVKNYSDLVISAQGSDTLIRFGQKQVVIKNVSSSVLTRSKNFPTMYLRTAVLDDLVNSEYYVDYNPGVSDSSQTPHDHYMLWGKDNSNLTPSRIFVPQYYLNKYPDVKAVVDRGQISAAMHFILYGQYEGRQPSPDFDPVYYLENNPDVKQQVDARGTTAFKHYTDYGREERRWGAAPKSSTTVSGSDRNDVLYGVSKEGDRFVLGKGRNTVYPSGTKNIYEISLDDAGTVDTIYWFNPAMDKIDVSKLNIHNITGVTVTQVNTDTQISLIGPVKNKLVILKNLPVQKFSLTQLTGIFTQALAAQELFDADFYVKKYPEVSQSTLEPYAHFQQIGKFKNYHPSVHFNPDYYLGNNAGLEAELFRLGKTAFDHFIEDGQYEVFRNPTPYFNTTYYLENNPDVAASQMTPIRHFKLWGKFEFSRNPSEFFQTQYYLDNNPAALTAFQNTRIAPIEHYITVGRYLDYIPSPLMQGNLVVTGTYRGDELFGSAGVTAINGLDDNDSLYLGPGTATATGGTGVDRFYISLKPGKQDIITDFNLNAGEKIVLSKLSHIETFDDLKISQQGSDTFIDLEQGQSLLLKNVNASQLNKRHFYCALSATRQINIYNVANQLTSVLDTIPSATVPEFMDTLRDDFKKFVINGFPTNNPQNQSIYKTWNKIDLSFFKLTQVVLTQRETSVIVDLGFGAELEITNVKLTDLHPVRSFILSSQESNEWKNELTQDWDQNDPVSIVPVKSTLDKITHDDEKVIYISQPTLIRMTNNAIPVGNPMLKLFKVPAEGDKQYVISNFNPDNPYQIIDLSELGINTFNDLGIAVKGYDTIVNTKNGRSIVLKNTNPNKLNESNFTGFSGSLEKTMSIFPVASAGDVVFNANDAEMGTEIIVDFTDVQSVKEYSELIISQSGSDTLIKVRTTGQTITFKNVPAAYFTGDKFISYPRSENRKRDSFLDSDIESFEKNFGRRFDNSYITANLPKQNSSKNIVSPQKVTIVKQAQYNADPQGHGGDITISSAITFSKTFVDETMKYGLDTIKYNKSLGKFLNLTLTSAFTAIDVSRNYNSRYTEVYQKLMAKGVSQDLSTKLAHQYAAVDTVGNVAYSLVGSTWGAIGGGAIGFTVTGGLGIIATAASEGAAAPFLPEAVLAGVRVGTLIGTPVGDVLGSVYYTYIGSHDINRKTTKGLTGFDEELDDTLNNPEHFQVLINKAMSLAPIENNPFQKTAQEYVTLVQNTPEGKTVVFAGKPLLKKNGALILPPADNDAEIYPYPYYDPTADNPISPSSAWSIFMMSTPNRELNYYQGKLYRRVDHTMVPVAPADNDAETYQNPIEVNPIIQIAKELVREVVDMTKIAQGRFDTIGNNFVNFLNASGYAQLFGNMALGDTEFDDNVRIIAKAFAEQELKKFAKEEAKKFAKTEIGQALHTEKLITENVSMMQDFATALVLSIGQDLASGKLKTQNIGPSVAMFSASYAVQIQVQSVVVSAFGGAEATASALATLNAAWVNGGFTAYLTALPAAIGPQIIIYIAVAVVMQVFGNDIIKAYEILKDIVKGFWDFLGDPINDLEDLWKKLNDDKWTYRTGSEGPDIMRSDSLWERIKMLGGADVAILFNGWNVLFAGDGDDICIGGLGTLNAHGNLYYDEIYGGRGRDFMIGRGLSPKINYLVGGPDDDTIIDGDADGNLYGDFRTADDGSPRMNDPYPQDPGVEGNDILDGGRGNNRYYPGGGIDRIIMTPHPGTTDIIYGFELATEVIDIRRIAAADWRNKRFHNLNITQTGADTVVDFSGQKRVIFKNTSAQQLGVHHFLGTRIALTVDDLFDSNYYKEQYNIPDGVDPKQHFITVGKNLGYNPSPVFNTNYYLSENADVKAAVDAGKTTAIDHFLEWGQDEEDRNPVPFFNNIYYSKTYSEVVEGSYVPLKHYISIGRFKNLKPSENYNTVNGLPVVIIAPTAGTPTAGTPTVVTPTAGTPTAGTPTAGTPTAGTPTPNVPTGAMPTASRPTAETSTDIPPTQNSTIGTEVNNTNPENGFPEKESPVTSDASRISSWFDFMWLTRVLNPFTQSSQVSNALEIYHEPESDSGTAHNAEPNPYYCRVISDGIRPILSCEGDDYTVQVFPKMFRETSELSTQAREPDLNRVYDEHYKPENCKVGSFYEGEAVYCEGTWTDMVYTQHRPSHAFEQAGAQAALLGVGWHLVKKMCGIFKNHVIPSEETVSTESLLHNAEYSSTLEHFVVTLGEMSCLLRQNAIMEKISKNEIDWLNETVSELLTRIEATQAGTTQAQLNILKADIENLVTEITFLSSAQPNSIFSNNRLQASDSLTNALPQANPPPPILSRTIAPR